MRARRCRVHRIPPRVRDDRDTPLVGRNEESSKVDLGQTETEIFLQTGLDTRGTEQLVGQISRPVRRGSKSEGGRRRPATRCLKGWIALTLIRHRRVPTDAAEMREGKSRTVFQAVAQRSINADMRQPDHRDG